MNKLSDIKIVDTMVDLPDESGGYSFLKPLLKGGNKVDSEGLPVSYMFKDAPRPPKGEEGVRYVLDEMDKYGVATALVNATNPDGIAARSIEKHPGRFVGLVQVNPNDGMDAVRLLESRYRSGGIVAACFYPAFVTPQVPINDKRAYPIYAKCAELDIPIFVTTGVPGPRVPMMAQHVELLDEVCWFFPELKLVMRHGGDPWTELAVKLLLKWPNLYYSTSGFAPKHYPRNIVDFANKRGSEKIIFAGYFPIGLTYERIFRELAEVPFKQDVLHRVLRDNAVRLLKLD